MTKNIYFKDHPDFVPNLTPKEMFDIGIMGGWYFREIKSPITGKVFKNRFKNYEFLKNMPANKYKNSEYDVNINKYKVKVGSSYEFWVEHGWIKEDLDPYGWIEWYINFYYGRRTEDDLRQIRRWKYIAGERGRFKLQLQRMINENRKGFAIKDISPKLRQILLHWGYDSSRMRKIV